MFITLDIEEQRKNEAREHYEEFDNFVSGIDLCDTCTKKEDCSAGALNECVSECSDYGKPN